MTRGLIAKAVRETWLTTALLGAAFFAAEVIFAIALPAVMEPLANVLPMIEFVRPMLTALLGTDVGEQLTPESLQAIVWVHPVVLVILWSHATVLCTRTPAGEVDRGTIDVLFGLPVSRWRVYCGELVVLAGSGLALIAAGVLGHLAGRQFVGDAYRTDPGDLPPLIANVACVYAAAAGLACLVSAASERRGRAMGLIFTILVASFLLNFLAQFWTPAAKVAFLSLLDYHQPLAVLRTGVWPVGDLVTLLAAAAAMWTAGGVLFARRDLCTV